MTDNSDFRSRYLPPVTGERHEPVPAADYSDDVSMPDPQMPDPQVDDPHPTPPHARPAPSRHSYAPTPGHQPQFIAPPPTEPASPEPARPPAAQHPDSPGGATWGPAGGAVRTPPALRGDAGDAASQNAAGNQPAPIPPMPRLDERYAAPPPAPSWAPPVDPAQRWAPRADPQVTGAPVRHIQVDEVVKNRREPATMGWRKAVYAASGTLVNLGAGPHERKLRDWTTRITSNIPGNYQIAVVSVKGGVGKTRMAAAVGSVFADKRGGGVIAVDADATYGGLARFVDPTMTATVREYLADPDAVTHPKTRPYTGCNRQRLEVLGGHQNVAAEFTFDQQTFFDTISRTRMIYQLCLVDCAEIEGDVFKAVLSCSDALMIVGSCTAEGGLAVETTVNWLAARRGHELLKRSVIVLNDAHRSATPKFISHINETVGKRVRTVKTVPWDRHLRDAATLDFPALRKNTQLALLDLAAELATGFPTAGALTG
jgi:MinD-like ATPase involved in chromosome partitioning or flagellar assembly